MLSPKLADCSAKLRLTWLWPPPFAQWIANELHLPKKGKPRKTKSPTVQHATLSYMLGNHKMRNAISCMFHVCLYEQNGTSLTFLLLSKFPSGQYPLCLCKRCCMLYANLLTHVFLLYWSMQCSFPHIGSAPMQTPPIWLLPVAYSGLVLTCVLWGLKKSHNWSTLGFVALFIKIWL